MSARKYTIRKVPSAHLSAREREILGTAWNRYIRGNYHISLREFARIHNIPAETWRREHRRGAVGISVRQGGRWLHAEYDAAKAQAAVDEGKRNMGAGMKLTVSMAIIFRHFVLEAKRSPYDARMFVKEALPEADVPCLRTFYNHIETGDMGVRHGQTPYHPGARRRPRELPHAAKVVPGRRTRAERPAEADARSELGHWEMDTVVSGVGGRGGVLVMVERMTRKYLIERLGHINQDAVVRAIGRLRRRGALGTVKSVTGDNGCEFLDQARLDRAFKARVYYTRACASWEKGSVENCNRILRRWCPKGTDFSRLSRATIQWLEDNINSIHRKSLNGETAHAYHSRLTQAG